MRQLLIASRQLFSIQSLNLQLITTFFIIKIWFLLVLVVMCSHSHQVSDESCMQEMYSVFLQQHELILTFNHFIDNSCTHTLSDLKFILIEQVATETEKFLEYRGGYWQAPLWTYEPYGFNAKKKDSIRGDVANF